MKNYILTGTPGSGKTSVINELASLGHSVIHEAATDIIIDQQQKKNSEPWKAPLFIDLIIDLQQKRQINLSSASSPTTIHFYDRSPFCTYALSEYLKFPPSLKLLNEIARIESSQTYMKQIFFMQNLGDCTPTDARKISYEESLIFEEIHRKIYTQFGYEIIEIPFMSVEKRAHFIMDYL